MSNNESERIEEIKKEHNNNFDNIIDRAALLVMKSELIISSAENNLKNTSLINKATLFVFIVNIVLASWLIYEHLS